MSADACLVSIVTGIVCAAVRWFHMCRPYDSEEHYFYPARRFVTLAYLSMALLEIPYFLNPSDTATVEYIGIVGILFYPMCAAALFRIYFRSSRVDRVLDNICIIGTFVIIATLLMILATGRGWWIVAGWRWIRYVAGAFSLALSVVLVGIMSWVYARIGEYHRQNYSDEDDFPYRFAEKVLWLPVLWIALMWVVFITGDGAVKAVVDLFSSALMVIFLVMILHPQRLLQPEAAREKAEHLDAENDKAAEQAYDEEAKRLVLEIIQRRFKEKHLQKKDVLAEVDKGKIASASRFITSIGYYNLVNMFRLEYARQYGAANPMAKQSVVAEASGFASGSSFSKAKRSVPEIDREIVSGVHL